MTDLVGVGASRMRPCAFFSDVVHMSLFARFGVSQTLFSIDPGLLQQDAQAIDLSDKISFAILAISFAGSHCR